MSLCAGGGRWDVGELYSTLVGEQLGELDQNWRLYC